MRRRFVLALLCSLIMGASAASAAAQSTAAWAPLMLLEHSIAPGTKQKFSYMGGRTFEGAFLDTAVFAARGAQPGPTLCLTALVHGDERNSFEIVRTAFAETDAQRLSGTLIALPAININGFRTGSRYMPDRRDLNRAFPGSTKGSNTGLVASIVYQALTTYCDAVIDLHTGSFDRANLPQVRVDLGNQRAVDLARRFGAAVVLGGAGPRGSLRREVMEAGIPAIIYEAGLPLRFEPEEIRAGVQGVRNVLIALGMLTGTATASTPAARVFASSRWLRVPVGQGGVFYPDKELGTTVSADEVIGHIDEPFSDQRFLIRADAPGTLIGMAVPQVVFSGYALIHVARNN